MEPPFDSPNESAKFGMNIGLFIAALLFVGGGFGWAYYKWAGPAYEQVRYETHKQSQSRVDGTITNLTRLRLEYVASETKEHRAGIRSLVLVEAAQVDRKKLPDDLRAWIKTLEDQNQSLTEVRDENDK